LNVILFGLKFPLRFFCSAPDQRGLYPLHEALIHCASITVDDLSSGKQVVARALLDSGAGIYLVSQRIVHQLQLPKASQEISISGAMGTKAGLASHMLNLVIANKVRICMEAVVVPKVTVTCHWRVLVTSRTCLVSKG